MRKNNHQIEKEVTKIKDRITKVLPGVNDVDIRIDKSDDGQYESFIKVHVPKKKELIASKRGYSIKSCLEKSHHAITRQIQRIKSKPYKKRFAFYDMDLLR